MEYKEGEGNFESKWPLDINEYSHRQKFVKQDISSQFSVRSVGQQFYWLFEMVQKKIASRIVISMSGLRRLT